MLIEASSFRLCIDLIQSLENSGFTATEIRLNFKGAKRYFEDKKSLSSSIRYSSLAAMKSHFIETYSQISNTGRNPFTFNKLNSYNFNKPSYKHGTIIQIKPTPDIGSDSIPNVFKLGRYAVIRGLRLSSNSLGFQTSYNCINIHKDTFKISSNTAFNNKRESTRKFLTNKSEGAITSLVNRYNRIHEKFFNLYLANKDYNLELVDFVGDGPTGPTYKLYELHYPLIKRPLDSGLSSNILNPRFLLKQE